MHPLYSQGGSVRGIRKVALAIAVALIGSSVGVRFAPAAFADDPGVGTIVHTLTDATDSVQAWSQGLATAGKLGESLPLVASSAGSVLGFTDLLSQAFNNGSKKLALAHSYGDFDIHDGESISLTGDRSGTLTSSIHDVDNGKQVDITVDVHKTVHDQPLNINVPIGTDSNAPQSAFTSTGGVDLTIHAVLSFSLVWDSASDTVYLVSSPTTPSLTVGATAGFGNKAAVQAGIGILGVSLVDDATTYLTMAANFKAHVNDPNNDGRLAFVNTDHTPGELAQQGSLAGLVSIGFDDTPGTSPGSIDANLHLRAAATTGLATSLPDVDANIRVQWDNIGQGSGPTVTPTGISTVGKFLNLTPRDLADGLGQLVTTLTDVQRAKWGTDSAPIGDVDLPFLKGTLADAVQINEALKKFLEHNTVQPAQDHATAGQPQFVSLQDMLHRLNTADYLPAGVSLSVGDVSYDDPTSKLSFKINLGRTAPTDGIDMNQAAAAASGGQGATYDRLILTDSSQHWTPNEFAGRHVVAGTSGATIESNTATVLTLRPIPAEQLPPNTPPIAWSPTVPTANAPYAISGMQGDVGVVQFANQLQTNNRGIAAANAVNATALVKPSYDAHVTLVLDLQPPTINNPPTVVPNGDGTTHLEASTPIAANRILVRPGQGNTSFTADFPIDADIDLFANAGFLQVELAGAMKVCATQPTGHDCAHPGDNPPSMVSVHLNGSNDLTFGQIIDSVLHSPASLIDYAVNVRGEGSVTASAPGTENFFPHPATASFDWNNVLDTAPADPDGPHIDTSHLTDLVNIDFDPQNPRQLFSIILKTLQTLDEQLGQASPTTGGIFDTDIPVIGRKLRDLLRADESGQGANVTYTATTITDGNRDAQHSPFPDSLVGRTVVVGTQVGVIQSVSANSLTLAGTWTTVPATGTPYVLRSELDDAISLLQAAPSENLQTLIRTVNNRLSHANTPITFEYRDDASVNNAPSLVINLDWHRSYHTSAPVQFDFNLQNSGLGSQELAGVQGDGLISLGVNGEVKVGLVVPLAPSNGPDTADALQILDNSRVSVGLDASVTNGSIATTIGPLSLSLGKPSADAPADLPDHSDKAQAFANYALALADNDATEHGTARSFTTFLQNVDPAVNTTNDAVDCGFGGTTALALCARLPLYIRDNPTDPWQPLITTDGHSNEFDIRFPKNPANGDYLNPGGDAVDGHARIETPNADDLATAIRQHIIDLARLDGIDGFLDLLINSLNAASFGGKLPLVGDDLQQGQDFIANLKRAIDTSLGGVAQIHSVSELSTWANGQMHDALQAAGMNPDAIHVDTQCSSLVESAPAPTVTPGTPDAGIEYDYEIVSYVTDSQNNKSDAMPGPVGLTMHGPLALSPAVGNHLAWEQAAGANGYKVYRKGVGADTSFHLLADVGTARTYDDHTPVATGAGPSNPNGPNPPTTDCDLAHFDTVKITADVSQGTFGNDGLLDCAGAPDGHHCITGSVPLDIGIPGLSIHAADPSQGPGYELGWRLHLAFGMSRANGFFIDTANVNNQPEFAVGLNLKLPDAGINAQLAFINITATPCTRQQTDDCAPDAPNVPNSNTAVPPAFGGAFHIDIRSPHGNDRLTLQDLSDGDLSQEFVPTLTAAVNIDWLLKANANVQGGAGFPGIQSEFRMHWAWSSATPGSNTDDDQGNDPLSISFLRVQINAGQAFSQIVGPIIQEIKKVTDPLDPVIKTLYAPIPVLSDLSHLVGGDDVTMVSIAKAFSTIAGGPDLTFVDRITQVIQIIHDLPAGDDHVLIPIGNFNLVGSTALSTAATPDNTDNLIDPTSKQVDSGASGNGGILDSLDSHDGAGNHHLLGGNGDSQHSAVATAGFQFPVFQHPEKLFNVLMGGDVELVTFDSGDLKLGFDWRQEFGPVYAPPPVLITLHGSASVTLRVKAGFDTYGLRRAFDAIRAGTFTAQDVGSAILQSLYFATTDTDGTPIPVVTFRGEIAAGAEVSAVIVTVGVEGGVALTVSFLWNDPNHDGKFRISEFVQAALNNPICLFSVSGELSVFLRLYVTIGVGPFSVSFDFTIVDVKLLDFNAAPDCAPPPPKLAGLGDNGHTLVVYAAALGHGDRRGGGDAWDSNNEDKDTVKVISLHDYSVDPPTFKGVAIEMLGIRNEFLNTNIDRVVVDGRGYTHAMSVTFLGDGKVDKDKTHTGLPTSQFEKDAVVFGGTGNDVIKTGIGTSWVDGGEGNDIIVTSDRTVLNGQQNDYVRSDAFAWVAGGAGDDSITVGNGADYVEGDGTLQGDNRDVTGLKELRNSSDPSVNVTSADPNVDASNTTANVPDWDHMTQPSDAEEVDTNQADGTDIINIGLGADHAYGNGGSDTLSVAADDPLAAAHPGTALFVSQGSYLVGGNGSDHFAGGSGGDHIYTGTQTDTAVDGTGPADAKAAGDPPDQPSAINIVDTGTGSDFVYGGQAVDRVTGHSLPTRVDPNTHQSLPAQTDDIRGGSGNDILIGGLGTDAIYGGPDDDYVVAEPSNVDLGTGTAPDDGFGPSYVVTHTALPAGVSPSHKTLVGGLGRDHIVGGDGGASVYGDQQTTPCAAGNPVASDPVNENVDTNEDGNDRITGGAGVENIRAGGGDDTVDAKGNNDLVCGEKGNDTLQGGSEDDQVWGGSDDDVIYGDTGADHLYGNAGTDYIYGGQQADVIEGNAGTDRLFGGDDADVVVGGTQASGRADAGDLLFGDTGNDVLIGDNGVPDGAGGRPLDLGAGDSSLGGADVIFAGDGADHAYGGLADDYIDGGRNDDYIEGNNATDTILGGDGQDDIIGGSSQVVSGSGLFATGYPDANDNISGGANEDVVLGDNGAITRDGTPSEFTLARGMTPRTVTPYDWSASDPSVAGDDVINGNEANDVVLGEAGADTIHGNAGDDYLEGNQGADSVFGDDGQDDILGGSSQVANAMPATGLSAVGEPDAGDTLLSGGDNQDVVLGDNGIILRTALTGATTVTGTLEDVTKGHAGMAQRRINLFDVGASAPGGDDVITGDNADDALFGEVGADTVNGNDGDDYIEGDQGVDHLHGDVGQDDILGGGALVASGSADALSAVGEPDTGDFITGDVEGSSAGAPDVILGDNGSVLRIGASSPTALSNTPDDAVKGHVGTTARRIRLYDLGDGAAAANSGADDITAQGGDDAAFGQGDNDRIKGGLGDDHLEGGQAADFIEGDQGDDDVVGGTSIILSGADAAAQGVQDQADDLFGGDGNDLVSGDNAVIARVGGGADANYSTKFTNRLTPDGGVVTTRWFRRLDLSVGSAKLLGDPAGRYGGDRVSGGKGVDVLFGQDGNDAMSGGPDDDYIEGNAGSDSIRGDRYLSDPSPTNVLPPAGPPATADQTVAETVVPSIVDAWVGTPGSFDDLEGPAGVDGQDDLIGGSTLQAFRDAGDFIEGDGEGDFQLGDNGALVRDFGAPDGAGVRHYAVYTARYPSGQLPANAVVVRHNDPTIAGMTTTRFCVAGGTSCEPAGSYGDDFVYGDGGDDTMWGQDGNDTMRGGTERDDMYGELGDDTLFGDAGQDAILGDRGGIVDTFVNGSGDPTPLAPYNVSIKSPPALSYDAFKPGTYDRRVDLLHDVNGASFVGSGAGSVMPHDGATQGGNDHVRGGGGHDSIHLGYGDDIANGDSGGDALFGDDGADVLWGGKGCDPLSLEDFNGTCTDPATDRGAGDVYVDYLFGGKGGTSIISQKGDVGSDIMDWQPRGSYPSGCANSLWPQTLSSGTTIDPCDWFLMTATYNDAPGTDVTDASHRDNQTHHGVDWMYGGWDRDVMQADQADEGPNTGDRLLDWNGAYNLYSHCNPSYGGYNDVRLLSPDEMTFMQKWSYGTGIGQSLADVTTSGTSAYDELALVYQSDMKAHGTGPDYPTTPGHFDAPNACGY